MEYRRCSLVLVRYKPAACSAEQDFAALDAVVVALAVAAGSAAWLVADGPSCLAIAVFATAGHLVYH